MTNEIKDKIMSALLHAFIPLFVAVLIVVIITAIQNKYCETNPSYFQDDTCFDVDYRCNIECKHYGLNYTGELDRCSCICNDGSKVSICSGYRYND